MTAKPADLLAALLDACRRGLVSIGDAAKLVGIRKADMGDLVAWRMAEAAVWRCYESAFRHAFPWTDASLIRRDVAARAVIGRRYSDTELLDPNSWNRDWPIPNKIVIGNSPPAILSRRPEQWAASEYDRAA